MRLTKVTIFIVAIFFLLGFSDFIYIYWNEPQKLAKIFIYFSLNEAEKGNFAEAVANLNKAASYHLRQNSIIYKNIKVDHEVKNNLVKLNTVTRRKILNYLVRALPKALEKNSASLFSNIYYDLGLMVYKINYHKEASGLLATSVNLDPELGNLYLELADLYFNDEEIGKGKGILKRCQQYKWPKKQCQEYLETNVRDNSFFPVGYFKQTIYDLQKRYF